MRRSFYLAGCGALLALALAACTSTTPTVPATSTSSSATATNPAVASSSEATPTPSPTRTETPTPKPAPTKPAKPPAALPLHFATGTAKQVITVVSSAPSNTDAVLQAWDRSGSGWRRAGPAVHAYLGSAGLSTHASEASTATPVGSFTLTQAFGHDANPGTALPYRQTTPADWWISQPGPLYNTEQHCATSCPFKTKAPNEHLYYELPYYDYALVINYNRSPVVQGAGSAFFLHVTVGQPTQGCVSIDKSDLIRLMQWLKPADHPRILMGIA